MLPPVQVYLSKRCDECLSHKSLNLRQNRILNRYVPLWKCVLKVLLESLIAELVTIFELSIIVSMALHRIIC